MLATTTPDTQWGNAAAVQNELGLRCGAFDVNAACSGFVYGLVNAHGMIAMGARKVLLIGTDSLSRIVDWEDRNTAILFGDGSGAVVLEAVEGPGQLLAWDLDADGSLGRLLYADVGGLHPDGGQRGLPACSAHHGRLGHEVDEPCGAHRRRHHVWWCHTRPTSASSRLRASVWGSTATVLSRCSIDTGNTSSASMPLALADALDTGRVKEGDLLLLVGFGGGMTAASAVLRWGGGAPAGGPA